MPKEVSEGQEGQEEETGEPKEQEMESGEEGDDEGEEMPAGEEKPEEDIEGEEKPNEEEMPAGSEQPDEGDLEKYAKLFRFDEMKKQISSFKDEYMKAFEDGLYKQVEIVMAPRNGLFRNR